MLTNKREKAGAGRVVASRLVELETGGVLTPTMKLMEALPAAEDEADDEPEGLKRLNVNLLASDHERLKTLAKEAGISMTKIIKWSLEIATDVLADADEGYRIVAVDRRGHPVKQYFLPYNS